VRERVAEHPRPPTPGPGEYAIDRALGGGPAAFHARRADVRASCGPGPGKYDTARRAGSEARAFSLRSRTDVKSDVVRAPYVALPEAFGEGSPKWSLFVRPRDVSAVAVPGPSYVPPPLGSDAVKCAVRECGVREYGRQQGGGPGPAKYNCRMEGGGPKWSMKARKWAREGGTMDGPGAGTYSPEYGKVLPADGKGRQILERFKERSADAGAQYVDIGGTNDSPKWTIGGREELALAPGSRD
jgi:hypothetical protein